MILRAASNTLPILLPHWLHHPSSLGTPSQLPKCYLKARLHVWYQTRLAAHFPSRALRVPGLQTHPLPAVWPINKSNRTDSAAVPPSFAWTLGAPQDGSAQALHHYCLETLPFLLGEWGVKAAFSSVKQKTPFIFFFLIGSASANEVPLSQTSSASLLKMLFWSFLSLYMQL